MTSNCVADNLKDLAACFKQEATQQGQITIDPSFLTADIQAVLGRDDVIISGVNPATIPDNPGNSLTICGTTPQNSTDSFLSLLGLPVCVNFLPNTSSPGPSIVLQMRVTLSSTWAFGMSFPEIAGQAADLLSFGAAYLYVSTVPAPLKMDVSACVDSTNPPDVAIAAGVSFWGTAGFAGPFAPVVSLLESAIPCLELYGPITRPAQQPGPSINLALVNTLSFTIPGQIITITAPTAGMEVDYISDPNDKSVLSPVTVPYIKAGVGVGGYTLDIQADLWEDTSTIDFVVTPAATTSTGFQAMGSLVGTNNVSSLQALVSSQPQVSALLDAIEFKRSWASVILGDSSTGVADRADALPTLSTPTLASVGILVGTPDYDFDPDKPPPPVPVQTVWTPFDGVSLAFNFYGAVFSPASSPLFLGELEATAWVKKTDGSYYIFTVDVTVPDFMISGSFVGTIDLNLATIVSDLFGNEIALPNHLADFQLSDITFSADVTGKNYSVGTMINGELFGSNVLQIINTSTSFTVDASGEKTAVTGAIDGIISLGGIEFQVDAVISNAPNVDTVLKLHMVNETVGSLLNHLVHLVDPGLDISLPAPWDRFLAISLDALELDINVTKGSVSVSYNASIDLVFLQIDTLTLTYQKDPVQSTVEVAISGSFLGQSYGKDGADPLSFDPVNGSPPAVPQGSLLDLRYLGIGQHVTVQGLQTKTTMADIIAAMEQAMQNTKPDFTQGMIFSDQSAWLIGTDFTLLSFLRLAVIFNDPNVYGLLVQLSGDKAGSFAGLSFEILYRKISDSIGLYHIDFTLPDEFRHLEFGEVSVTLPAVIVDIYTNGNFLIDLGFPYNMDFSQSFSVQVFPFVGYGGLYFGVLSGATSSRVPQITNGTWDPVVVFGLGLSLGVGKTIDEGVLSAGLSVTVEGVLEGVIGWFNPSSSAVPSDHYYWLQGTAAIVGQLYGTVDFKIIKASVSVTAYASVTLIVEAYEPIYLNLTAGVSVSVSLKVVFFTIHFSFKATISASWSIGSKGTPPWQVAAGSQQATAAVLFRPTLSAGRLRLPAQMLGERMGALRAAANEAPLQWTPVPQFYTSPQPLNVVIGPVFTVTDGVPQCVPLLFLENSIDPDALTPAEIRNVRDPAQAANQPFNLLTQAMLQWAIEAWQRTVSSPDGTINLGNLQYILEQLDLPDAEDSAFPYANLAQFLDNNFNLQLSLRPATIEDDSSAAVFPMIPELSMTAGGTTVYFNDQSAAQVDASYADKLAAYFAALSAEFMQGVAPDGSTGGATSSGTASTESLATAVFRNYFFMIVKAAVRSALDLLTAYPYTPGNQSLQQIVQTFPAVKGQEVTAESIVHANQSTQDILLQQKITLSGVSYQARSGDTISSWLKPFGLDPITMLTAQIAPSVSANAYRPGLLQPGATLTINSASAPPSTPLTLTSRPGDTFDLIASLLLVRSAGPSIYPQFSGLAGLAQAIARANNLQLLDPNQPLPSPGAVLTVPNGANPAPTYTVRPGDSLYAVAAYFLNVQQKVVPIDKFVNALITSYPTIDPNNVPPNTSLTLPEIDHVVLAGETVASIAATFLMPDAPSTADITTLYNASTLASLALQPLATIPLPEFQYTVQGIDTLGSIAEQFNLTLAGLAQALFTQSPLFSGSASIVVPNVPAIKIQDLLDTMLTAGNINTVSSMVSRFLLHGMQVPLPSDPITAAQLEADPSLAAKVAVAPLYQLLGQQVATPGAPPTITFANAGNVSWITFAEGTYSIQTQGETLASILSAFVSSAQGPDFTTWLGTLNPTANLQQLNPPTVLTFPVAAPLPPTYTVQNPNGESIRSISEALAPGQPATLRAQIESLASNNGINFTQALPPGTVVTLPPSFPNLQLELVLNSFEQTLSAGLQNIQVDGNSGLQLYRLPLYHNTPHRYTLQKHIPWQAAQLPPYLGPAGARASGTPSVWMFPNGLIQALEGPADPYLRYGLYTGVQQTANGPMTVNPVQTYAWGTLINVELQRIPETVQAPGASNAYLLAGADEVGQELLYSILPYVDVNTSVSLLYQPNPGSQNAAGYASDALDSSATFILQTNLSQLSNSPSLNAAALSIFALDAAPVPVYAAAIADGPNFLRLLWECGVVRSGGYYLNYVTGDGQAALPASVFSGGDSAIIGLLVVLNGASVATPAQDPPASYLNCAVVADNIDGGSANVFVQPLVAAVQTNNGVNDTLNSLTSNYNATYVKPPGQNLDVPSLVSANQNVRGLLRVGALVLLAAPPGPTYPAREGDTFASIVQTQGIDLSTLATLNATADILQPGALVQFTPGQLDQGAAVQPGNTGFTMQRPAPTVGGPPIPPQAYADQMFQLLEFQIAANSYFTVSGPGLPAGPGDADPYGGDALLSVPGDSTASWNYRQVFSITRFAAGVQDVPPITAGVNLALPPRNGGPYAGVVPGAEIQLSLSFRDILGNTGSVNPPLALSPIPVGYFDDLISLAQWPGIAASYLFSGTPAQLDITLVFQPGRYMPGGNDSPDSAIRSAGSAAARFAQIFCQLRQDDLSLRYRTTMDAASLVAAVQGVTDPYLLDKSDVLAQVAHAYLFTTAMGALQAFTYPPTTTDSVQSVCDAFAVSPGQLFTANQSAAQNALFGALLNVPVQYATRPQDSLNSIVTSARNMEYTVTPQSLAEGNNALPLQTGTVLLTPQARTYVTTGSEKLQDVTNAMNCSIAGIVSANNIQGVLQEGFIFRMTGQNGQVVTYPVGSSDTFGTVAAAFGSQYQITASPVDVAVANQLYPGMFASQKSLSIPDLVVGEQQSLSSIHTKYSVDIDALAEGNAGVPDIFPPSTVVQLLMATAQNPEETLAEITVQYQCSLDALAGANTRAGFASQAGLLIPGRVVSPQPCAWPYRAAGTENITDLAGRFKFQPLDLLALSQDIPGIFQPNIPISVGKAKVQTTVDSTVAGLLAALQQQDSSVQPAQLAAAVANQTILRSGGLIVLPPILAGQYGSLEALAGALNVSVPDLAGANAALQGFLQPNAAVSYSASSGVTWKYTVGPNDTLNTLLARCNAYLQAQGVTTPATLAGLATANSSVTLVSAATSVLPPPPGPVSLSMPVQQNLPGAMFPLAVELELDRPQPEANGPGVIDPDFVGVTSVYQSATALSPQGFASGDGDTSGANPSLRPFAAAFEAAFPGLKVATGQGISEVDTTKEETVWVVDFQTAGGGITPIHYQVQGDAPVFFAVPPISRKLWGETVHVPGYVSGQGLTPDQPKTFQSVDLDVWGRMFLEAVDLVLSPAYAVPANQIDPTDLATLVAAKGTLATAISQGLTGVLQGQTAANQLQAAVQTLEQNLLVQLAQAYTVDTVVQYPVQVSSTPYSDSVTAARLSGKVSPNAYITGPTDDLTTLAAAFQVSAPYVATTIATYPGILAQGQVVQYGNSQPYPIGPSETLSTVAAHFNVPVAALAGGLTLQNPKLGLFAAQTTINISGLSHQTGSKDTFVSLAEFFDTSLENVGLANEAVGGLIPAGSYTINKQTVVVNGTETLSQIAQDAGTTPDRVPVSLATTQLQPNVPVFALQTGQVFSLSTAKVELAPPAAGADPTLTFLFSARSPGTSRSETLNLDYVVNAIECPLGPPNSDGYQPSTWLSFILPLSTGLAQANGAIGQVEIPIPLRAYPNLPVMQEQQGTFAKVPPTNLTLQDLRQWAYSFTYSHQSAAQDDTCLTVQFNQTPGMALAPQETYTLPQALARFVTVWPLVQADLALLPQIPQGSSNSHAGTGLAAFATLAGDVAAAWLAWTKEASALGAAGPAAWVYQYELNKLSNPNDTLAEVILTLVSWPSQDQQASQLGWPDVSVAVAGQSLVLLDKHPNQDQNDPSCTYTYPGGTPPQTQNVTEWQFSYAPLDLMVFQNAWAGVSITRNANLLSGSDTETSPLFVYSTPTIGFANKLVPFLTTDDVISFGQGNETELQRALQSLFTTLLDGQTATVGVACRYGYEIQPGDAESEGIIPLLPILLYPPGSSSGLAGTLYTAIDGWYRGNALASTNAAYYLSLSIYSSLDAGDSLPLLTAGWLSYGLTS